MATDFVPVDSLFELNGKQYIAKNVPRQFWPCQCCAFYEDCLELKEKNLIPECKQSRRKDRTAVVFVEWTAEMARWKAKQEARRREEELNG